MRFLSKLAALLLCCSLLCGLLPASALAQDAEGPRIPIGWDLRGYAPKADGYYAVLPVYNPHAQRYYDRRAQLPLLVYQNTLLADAESLSRLEASLSVIRTGNSARLASMYRTLELTSGEDMARIMIGSQYSAGEPLIDQTIRLHGAPWLYNDRFWVPLMDVLGLLGIRAALSEDEEGDTLLLLLSPERTVIDVLADLYDEVWLQRTTFEFPEENLSEVTAMAMSAGLVLAMDNITSFPEFYAMLTDTNIAPFIDQVAEAGADELLETTSDLLGALSSVYAIFQDLDQTASINLTALGDDSLLTQIAETLNAFSAGALGAAYQQGYESRDRLAIDSLEAFIEKSDFAAMGEDLKAAAETAVKALRGSGTYAISRSLKDVGNDIATDLLDSLKDLVSKRGASVYAVLGAYTQFASYYNVVEKALVKNVPSMRETLSEMEDFEKVLYGRRFQKDAEAALRQALAPIRSDNPTVDEMAYAVQAAYLYLKCSSVVWQDALHALNVKVKDDSPERALLNQLARDLAVLASCYEEQSFTRQFPGHVGFTASAEVAQQQLAEKMVPLYTVLTGTVENKKDHSPVSDAHVQFSCGDLLCGFVSGTPDGRLDAVAVPLCVPDTLTCDTARLFPSAVFSSPSVGGADHVSAPFAPGGQAALKPAQLGLREVVYGNDPVNFLRLGSYPENAACYAEGNIYFKNGYQLYSAAADGSGWDMVMDFSDHPGREFQFMNYYDGAIYCLRSEEWNAQRFIARYDLASGSLENLIPIDDGSDFTTLQIVNDDMYYAYGSQDQRWLTLRSLNLKTGENNVIYEGDDIARCLILGCYEGYLYLGILDRYDEYNAIARFSYMKDAMNDLEQANGYDLSAFGSDLQYVLKGGYYLYYSNYMVVGENGLGLIVGQDPASHSSQADFVYYDYRDIETEPEISWESETVVEGRLDWEHAVPRFLYNVYDLDGTLVMVSGDTVYTSDTYDFTQAQEFCSIEDLGCLCQHEDQLFIVQYPWSSRDAFYVRVTAVSF